MGGERMEKAMILIPGFESVCLIVIAAMIALSMVNKAQDGKDTFTSATILILLVGFICGLVYGQQSELPTGPWLMYITAGLLVLIGTVAYFTRKSTRKAMHWYSIAMFWSVLVFYGATVAVYSWNAYIVLIG